MDNNIIENNTLVDSYYGIWVSNSDYNTVYKITNVGVGSDKEVNVSSAGTISRYTITGIGATDAGTGNVVVTVTETTRAGVGHLSIVSYDKIRLAATSQTGAIVESVAIIPGDLDEDQVWIVVKRTINGATKRFVEYLTAFDFGVDVEDAFFVDSGLTYTGSAASTISGLGHLEGESVTILANGAAHANKTVSSGSITLDRTTTKAHIGLGFTSTLKTMRLEGGAVDGTSQGKIKRIHDVTLRLYRSVGAKIGPSTSSVDGYFDFR